MASLSLAFDILARDKASKEFDKVGRSVDETAKKGKKFGPAMAAGAAVAAAAIVSFAKDSVSAFVESEQSSARLDDALKRFPLTNDRSRASFDKLNESLAKKTKFDDDATASGQAVLAQFKLTGSQIQQLTPLLQDYAAKTGKDIPTAADTLGKALLGKGKALGEVGIKFKDAGSVGANFEQITKGLRTQVGGFAEAEGKTAAGTAAILGNRFGEVQEKVGAKLTPALTTLANKLLEVIGFIERNQAVIVPLVTVLGGLAAVVITVNTAAKAYAATQAALNIVLSANPIGIIVIAVAALVAGLVLAYRNSETFRTVVINAFKAVAGVVLGAIDKWLGGFEMIFRALGKLPGVGGQFTKIADAVSGARGKVQGLANAIDNIPSTKRVNIIVTQTDIKRDEALANRPPMRALGGPVSGGKPYLVGEFGPELVVPPRDGFVLTAGETRSALSGGATTYNINVASVDSAQLVSVLKRLEVLNA